jgi:hypothetical protein
MTRVSNKAEGRPAGASAASAAFLRLAMSERVLGWTGEGNGGRTPD